MTSLYVCYALCFLHVERTVCHEPITKYVYKYIYIYIYIYIYTQICMYVLYPQGIYLLLVAI